MMESAKAVRMMMREVMKVKEDGLKLTVVKEKGMKEKVPGRTEVMMKREMPIKRVVTISQLKLER